MLQLQPIPWGGQLVLSRAAAASGAALHNCYLTPISQAPPFLTGTPGLRQWARAPFLAQGSLATALAGIHGMIGIDSPVYGHRLFGVTAEYQFFELRFGGTASTDPGTDYDPFRASNPSPVHTATRIFNFTADASKRAIGPVRFASDGRRILWAIKRDVWMWDMAANSGAGAFHTVLAPIPDNDQGIAANATAALPDEEWVDVAYIDGYFFLAARNGQLFHSLLNDPNFDQLDQATANAKDDPTVGLGTYQRRLFVFGTRSVEQWWHRPRNTDFAFQRDTSFVADVGAAARDTIQSYEDGVCFLGSDGIAYRFGQEFERLSNDDIEREIRASDMAQARAFVYTEEGHRFYSLTLTHPDGTRTNWTLDLTMGLWHTRSLTHVQAFAVFRFHNYLGLDNAADLYSYLTAWGTEGAGAVTRSVTSRVMYARAHHYRIQTVQLVIREPGSGTVQLAKSLDGGETWENVAAPKSLSTGLVIWSGTYDSDRADMETLLNEHRLNLRLTFTADHPIDISNSFMRIRPVE